MSFEFPLHSMSAAQSNADTKRSTGSRTCGNRGSVLHVVQQWTWLVGSVPSICMHDAYPFFCLQRPKHKQNEGSVVLCHEVPKVFDGLHTLNRTVLGLPFSFLGHGFGWQIILWHGVKLYLLDVMV